MTEIEKMAEEIKKVSCDNNCDNDKNEETNGCCNLFDCCIQNIASALYRQGYRKQEDTVKEFANIVISECEHLQEHCEEMNNNDAYDYVEILIAEINRQSEQFGNGEC